MDNPRNLERVADQRAENMIREAEAAKAKMLDVTGMLPHSHPHFENMQFATNTTLMDESFLMVASHIDETLRRKIENGEYVDFAKLLPRERGEDNQGMLQLINQNGHFGWIPEIDKNNVISNFYKWEQAFHVFSDVYSRVNPTRAAELIQYNHVISTASSSYTWENVYKYDKHFRMHMARNPLRSWAIILQQVWTMFLKDRNRNNNSSGNERRNKRDICCRYNKGKCTYGTNCKFDHRCGICGKFGHAAHLCRRADKHDKHDKQDRFDNARWNDKKREKNPDQ